MHLAASVEKLKELVDRNREYDMVRVRSDLIVPDSSNRGHTGLSADHVHFIATCILKDGFRCREGLVVGREAVAQAHDIPVVVRGGPACPFSMASREDWQARTDREPNFPPCKIPDNATEWFTSLGNGHFSQALNLFRQQVPSMFTKQPFVVPTQDFALRRALETGVNSIVLSAQTSMEDRRTIAILLNDTHDYKWTVDKNGQMDIRPESCYTHNFSQFEALSKSLDSEALTGLIRLQLGYDKEDDKSAPNPEVEHRSRL